ncbi:MAG: alpha/beta hydrolase [Propionibacteriaceae bacterium]|nr:alpha/beta hydrolase [Propionibacteriaceae bacterium]
MNEQNLPSVILVPGLWLGGWAWDDVAAFLPHDTMSVVALTLPGLESQTALRDGIHLADHVGALVDAIRKATGPVILVVHSGAGALASAALDQTCDKVRRVVYVDTGPVADGTIARPDLPPDTTEVPLPPWTELETGGASLAGLSQEMLQRFQARAVPHPAGPLLEPVRLTNPARNQVPATVVCCSVPSAIVRQLADTDGMFALLKDLTDLTYTDLPTGHWPLWSAPQGLADIIAQATTPPRLRRLRRRPARPGRHHRPGHARLTTRESLDGPTAVSDNRIGEATSAKSAPCTSMWPRSGWQPARSCSNVDGC